MFQENLLGELSRNGDVLHDAGLLASLNSTRAAAETVREALAQAQVTIGVIRFVSYSYRFFSFCQTLKENMVLIFLYSIVQTVLKLKTVYF